MVELNKKEMLEIIGGISISGAIINAFRQAGNAILDAGRSFGSALRRLYSKNLCVCK